jgi:16S rRNA (adenine1518-N6/adenine1519-N6)-dimethyltransferase
MKLAEMKQILSGGRIQLTRSLGQNFLHDGNQLRRIVEAADLTEDDKVLEIGPGLGPLTELLVAKAGEVLAIERDARLVEVLRDRFSATSAPSQCEGFPVSKSAMAPNLRLIHDDALEFLKRERRNWSDWKLVANLPYSVASPILVELAQSPGRPERMVVTLQLEVAKRLMADPGKPDYGVLTLLVQLEYEPLNWFKIPAGCFFPAPDVDSACVSLRRRAQPLLGPEYRTAFARIVKRSFSQRRKMMLKLMKEDWPAPDVEQAFEQLQLPPQARAETVGLEQFVLLTRELAVPGPPARTTTRRSSHE